MLSWLDETTPLPLDPRLLSVEGLALEAELVDFVVADKGVEDRLIEVAAHPRPMGAGKPGAEPLLGPGAALRRHGSASAESGTGHRGERTIWHS